MIEQATKMSSVKLGFAVGWSAFWTGAPFKCVIALLLLAMGLHPWEMPALGFLLLLSIPIDIWALGLAARTVFLERLRLQPAGSLGVTLWWQAALFNAVYLPLGYVIESRTTAGAQAVAAKIMEIEPLKSWPVAERISIELVLWSSVAAIVLILIVLGWMFLFGLIVGRQVATAHPAHESYQALVRQWDLMRVPDDQPLLLTVLIASGVLAVLLFWGFMPVLTPHPHEDYEMLAQERRLLKPTEALEKTDQALARAEAALKVLEEEAQKGSKGKTKL